VNQISEVRPRVPKRPDAPSKCVPNAGRTLTEPRPGYAGRTYNRVPCVPYGGEHTLSRAASGLACALLRALGAAAIQSACRDAGQDQSPEKNGGHS
jgi:hypothetical protein